MNKFVKLGNTWFRPEDVKWFQSSPVHGRTKLHMLDGNEWNVDMTVDQVAKVLNEKTTEE
jgi:hypothetical protein